MDTPLIKLNNGVVIPQLGMGVFHCAFERFGSEVARVGTHAVLIQTHVYRVRAETDGSLELTFATDRSQQLRNVFHDAHISEEQRARRKRRGLRRPQAQRRLPQRRRLPRPCVFVRGQRLPTADGIRLPPRCALQACG